MKVKHVVLIIILVLILGILCSRGFNDNNSKNKTINTSTSINNTIKEKIVPNGEVGIVSHNLNSWGSIYVIIKNNTGKELEYVNVKASCKDKDGINLGNSNGSEYNINTTDKYKITIFCGTDTKTYDLTLDYKIKE